MSFQRFYYNIIVNLKNVPGWHTKKKIVVIECDDFGSIRVPSKDVFKFLAKQGIYLATENYVNDTLESAKDLEYLFDVLTSIKDKNGNFVCLTPGTIMANPDFEKIRKSNFSEFHYERFTDTLRKNDSGNGIMKIWEQGISSKVFFPEYHGREHISVHFWLKELQEGNDDVLLAFNHEAVSVPVTRLNPAIQGFRPELFFDNENQISFLNNALTDGVKIFQEAFGFKPTVFIPSDSIFHPYFELTIANTGIKFVNVNHLTVIPDGYGGTKRKHYKDGQKLKSGLRSYIRNCAFEPTSIYYRGIEQTMKQISAAFFWHKPAIISTHRVNFVGGISEKNREKGLKELKKLLKAIIREWPDVEFMVSAEALNHMDAEN